MGFNEALLVRRRDELHDKNVRVRFIGRRDWRAPACAAPHGRDRRADAPQHRADPHDGVQLRRPGRDPRRRPAGGVRDARRQDHREAGARPPVRPRHARPRPGGAHVGEFRLSNFMLWELAYSELVFTDVLWPDFRREHLFDAIREYQSRDAASGACARASGAGRLSFYHDRGVVLRTHKLGARPTASSSCSPRARQGSGSGQGVRKTKSRFGGRLEPPCHVDLLVYEGREARHREPGRDHRPLPDRARRPRPARPGGVDARGRRPAGPGAPTQRPAVRHAGRRPTALAEQGAPLVVAGFFLKALALEGSGPTSGPASSAVRRGPWCRGRSRRAACAAAPTGRRPAVSACRRSRCSSRSSAAAWGRPQRTRPPVVSEVDHLATRRWSTSSSGGCARSLPSPHRLTPARVLGPIGCHQQLRQEGRRSERLPLLAASSQPSQCRPSADHTMYVPRAGSHCGL